METKTEIKIKDTAQDIFHSNIGPNLSVPILDPKDKNTIISAIEDGLRLAINQGRKW